MSFHHTIDVDAPALERGTLCAPILDRLPAWFGAGALLCATPADIDATPTLLAHVQGNLYGFLSFKRHNTYAAEIILLGVQPDAQSVGIGRALLRYLEKDLHRHEVEYVHVFLPTPEQDDKHYAKTRRFFFQQGYRPMLELPERLAANRPALLMAKKLKGGLATLF
ncbi:MAG: GNAT family N-acetyltransferase [Anaerolineales bacterium]